MCAHIFACSCVLTSLLARVCSHLCLLVCVHIFACSCVLTSLLARVCSHLCLLVCVHIFACSCVLTSYTSNPSTENPEAKSSGRHPPLHEPQWSQSGGHNAATVPCQRRCIKSGFILITNQNILCNCVLCSCMCACSCVSVAVCLYLCGCGCVSVAVAVCSVVVCSVAVCL